MRYVPMCEGTLFLVNRRVQYVHPPHLFLNCFEFLMIFDVFLTKRQFRLISGVLNLLSVDTESMNASLPRIDDSSHVRPVVLKLQITWVIFPCPPQSLTIRQTLRAPDKN